MKKFLLLFCIVLTTICNAQSWCLPGATWHYSLNQANASGYYKSYYAGDVILNGITCQNIKYETHAVGAMGPINQTTDIYTYEKNKVVYIKNYDNTGSITFDTLYNFSAKKGDRWRLTPTTFNTCSVSHINVEDTGSFVINNIKLKWLKVKVNAFMAASPSPGATLYPNNLTDTIIERIGGIYANYYFAGLCPNVMDAGGATNLRCYSDNTLGNFNNHYSKACDYVLGINNAEDKQNIIAVSFNADLNAYLFKNDNNEDLTIDIYTVSGQRIETLQLKKNSSSSYKLANTAGFCFFTASNSQQIISRGKLIGF